jgi:hypothetical protein
MNAVLDDPFTRAMAALGRDLPEPEAVLCVCAHWLAGGAAPRGKKLCNGRPGPKKARCPGGGHLRNAPIFFNCRKKIKGLLLYIRANILK